ncbi:hypothetical protein [Klebsiella pneumoniae]|uniref:hypothetical protein n=1 Tax=Klebsiella pneumoniae TaxID=573 RepID=UPI003873565C
MGEISVKTGNNARNGGKNSLNRLIRCVCGKKIGPDPRNFNQRVSLGRNDLLIRTFPREIRGELAPYSPWFGRGLIQITGADNYSAYERYIGEDVTSSDSARDKLITIPHCILSAFWYFNVFKTLHEDACNDDFNKVTAKINGGFIHYNERLSLFNRLVTSLHAEHLNEKYIDGDFSFENSGIYNNKVYALGWGLWHDPGSSQQGTVKSKEKALTGYRRAKDLIAFSPFPQEGREGLKKIYGIERRNVAAFVDRRITELESSI